MDPYKPNMSYQKFEHIAAGQFRADTNSSHIFQAFLGTCLGVTLFDHTTRTGGLIHILLPEPPGMGQGKFPEKYASTGIPLLIEQLKNLGCRTENLRATLAGGGLVGPVNRQDMGLDIGGRSAEIAANILKNEGIHIICSETGGFFNCTLELDMATGEARIKPPWEEEFKSETECARPTIEDIKSTVNTLKPIPQTALKILRMFQNDRSGIADITRELSQDQVLSAQTLKICNSALFAGTMSIETLKDAVILLGEELLVKSVITAAVNSYYGQVISSGYSLCKGGLFFHAVNVASTAEKLAEKSGKVPGKHAYTAGLLHDIGKVVLDQFVADSVPLLFRNLSREGESFLSSEKKLLGITHCEAGALLAKNWQFSPTLYQTIAHHHLPEKAPEEHRDMVSLVYLADLLMERFNTGVDLEKMQVGSIGPVLDRLGISMSQVPEIIDGIPIIGMNNNNPFGF
ncbi:HDOD domain-containing protein [Desulfospira joergensenii]|uniref:HDOD domain-containing protein n=1 Tax=Desulfospira joergensenii TaxID=53329 RepID=UPI0003B743B0|nr:HDOD domain-containing protein [Desulfospira joergensenii]